MEINYNETTNVNDYIKLNKLTPSYTELLYGHCYDIERDTTTLVIDNDNSYTSYYFDFSVIVIAKGINGKIVICKGEIE